ncbi:LutC/YkgG family protein [Sphingobacterium paludis]|uniref:L-lactate dehydrogenase complex protein LldG n=1 Tax=Sphingobacterium paludis TaxID=1476465 RepID=A0A4V3E1U1_9SPHI|nr:LUD domain-containing protein [Sphingobacterium paludis]TDS14608.1 L-lactate dehydrogenase complex protein LldG [Sphingobacterium paludis]
MNIRNTTAKERMLKKIRQALLQKRENPYLDFEDSPLYKDETEPLDLTFARELTAVAGNFVYCDGEIALIENLILLAESLKIKKIHAWEYPVQQLLDQYGFPVYTTPNNFQQADAAITICEALIARNGSVLISNADASGRSLSVYPPVHIVIAKASQLVMDVKHALRKVQEKYADRLPSVLTIISGPSLHTNFIDQTLAVGQGSKELYVFLLEDRF